MGNLQADMMVSIEAMRAASDRLDELNRQVQTFSAGLLALHPPFQVMIPPELLELARRVAEEGKG